MQERKYKTIGRCDISGTAGDTITNVTYTRNDSPMEEYADADRLVVLQAQESAGTIASLTEVGTHIRRNGNELFKYKDMYLIPEQVEEELRGDFRPTPQQIYEKQKEEFDEMTGS